MSSPALGARSAMAVCVKASDCWVGEVESLHAQTDASITMLLRVAIDRLMVNMERSAQVVRGPRRRTRMLVHPRVFLRRVVGVGSRSGVAPAVLALCQDVG